MRIRNYFFILLVPALLLAQNKPEVRISLNDAIIRALAVSDQISISGEDLARVELKIGETGAMLYPKLDLVGQYLFTSKVMRMVQPPTTVTTPLGAFTIPGKTTSFGDQHTSEFQLKLSQPLFAGFALTKSHRAAQKDALVARTDYERVRREVALRAEETYINAQKAQALVKVSKLQIETLQRHVESANKRVSEGVAPQEIAARADFALLQANLQVEQANNGYSLAMIALRELMKIPEDSGLIVMDSLGFTESVIPGDIKTELGTRSSSSGSPDSVKTAMQQRLELESVRLQKQSLQDKIGVQKASYYPTLNAFGSLNYGRPGVDRIANDWMFYQTIGLALNWTVWDWNLRKNRVQQIQTVDRQLDDSYSALTSKVRIEVEQARVACDDAQKRFNVACRGKKLASDVFSWVQQRYNQGTATESEFLDAQDDVNKSSLQIAVAQGDVQLAYLALKRACGTNTVPPNTK